MGLSQRVESQGVQIGEWLTQARPDMGESGAGVWVARVYRGFLASICAADEHSVRSGSGENGCAGIVKGGRGASQASRKLGEGRK